MSEVREQQYQLVVIGASAGGIDALLELVGGLAEDFPAPIVIAQHLDPRRPSHLAEILQRRSRNPVFTVEQATHLSAGRIFVVPSNRNVEIGDHDVRIVDIGSERTGPRPSVDRLLGTAARTFGETLIAVILSGSGSDGAAGARLVKAMGGTVIIQDPESASFPEMPRSLAPSTVDIVANLDSLPGLLHDLITGAFAPTQPDEDRALRSFLGQLRERSGIDFASYKRPTILRRLQRRMLATGTTRLRDYVRYVQQHPDEYQRLTSSFLVKVTEFFRDADLFEYLRGTVMPPLIATAREHGNELRVWSAGCATGEEAYSLAIMISEALGDEVDDFTVRIFATDLDLDAVNFARRGIYSAATLGNVPEGIVARYFSRVGDDFEIRKNVRAMTVFGQHDLGQRAPFPRIDLALCRNVLIYFTTELQMRALQLFAFSLRDGGYLILGKAETTSPFGEAFALEHPRLKVYRRQGQRVLIPPARIRDTLPVVPVRKGGAKTGWSAQRSVPRRRDLLPIAAAIERPESLLDRLPLGLVTVDRAYDIQWIGGAARRLLAIHGTAIGQDFIHLVGRLPAQEVRAAIDGAFRGETTTRVFEAAAPELPAPRRWLQVTFQPHGEDPEGSAPPLVAILALDVTESVEERQALVIQAEETRARADELAVRMAELTRSNTDLVAANDELASGNADLRRSNEELLVANEEVQAATEEVETLNEELQATVEELNTTNDDLEARSIELTESAASLESQRRESEAARARLEAVLTSMTAPVLFVARDGALVTNPAYDEQIGSVEAISGEDHRTGSSGGALRDRAAKGEVFQVLILASPKGGDRRRLVAEGRPVRVDGETQGGVIVFREVGEGA